MLLTFLVELYLLLFLVLKPVDILPPPETLAEHAFQITIILLSTDTENVPNHRRHVCGLAP